MNTEQEQKTMKPTTEIKQACPWAPTGCDNNLI